jgi:hypothetical protein
MENTLRLRITIADGYLDTREAPWYGPWNMVLEGPPFKPLYVLEAVHYHHVSSISVVEAC